MPQSEQRNHLYLLQIMPLGMNLKISNWRLLQGMFAWIFLRLTYTAEEVKHLTEAADGIVGSFYLRKSDSVE